MKFLRKPIIALGAALCGFLIAAAAEPPQPLPEDKKPPGERPVASPLEGGYTIVSGERDGKPIPEERIKGSIVRFVGDKILAHDKDKKEFFAATYTLVGEKSPWVIKMKSSSPKEAEAVGMIKKEGDTITIVYALPGGDAPTDFKTKDKQHLFVLKNLNKGDKPKVEKP